MNEKHQWRKGWYGRQRCKDCGVERTRQYNPIGFKPWGEWEYIWNNKRSGYTPTKTLCNRIPDSPDLFTHNENNDSVGRDK